MAIIDKSIYINMLLLLLLFRYIAKCLQYLGRRLYVSFIVLMPAVVHMQIWNTVASGSVASNYRETKKLYKDRY
jgi:hypothetical protein